MQEAIVRYWETKCQLLKSSWGISICMGATGTLIHRVSLSYRDDDIIGNKIIVRIQPNVLLTFAEKEFLRKAITRVERVAEQTIDNSYLLVDITKLEFNLCDYQEEGLYVVFIKWVTEFLAIEKIDVPATYDKNSNRYVFQLDKLPLKVQQNAQSPSLT